MSTTGRRRTSPRILRVRRKGKLYFSQLAVTVTTPWLTHSHRNAFARRLSKRMRHMPQDPSRAQAQQLTIERPPPHSPPSSDKTLSPPIDSAYASSIEKHPNGSEAGGGGAGPVDGRQPIKGFTLFPQQRSQPNAPPYGMPVSQQDPAEDHTSVATSMSKGRSFGSMRRYLHLRKSSKMWS